MRLMQLIALRHLLPSSLRIGLRGAWEGLLNVEQAVAERGFYRQFIRESDLVFDVGANHGGKTAAFLSLGARVVAIEPNPTCVASLLRRFPREIERSRLVVLPLAIGRSEGSICLRQFSSDGCVSSASDVFVAAMEVERGESIATFTATIMPAASLFDLYGMPDFVKIDVEGMDAEVLSGIPNRPRFLSFEFNLSPALVSLTEECLSQVTRLGFTEANFTHEAVPNLILPAWVPQHRILEEIKLVAAGRALWGDIIVR